MKYRILYPLATEAAGIEGLAGDVVTVSTDLANGLCAEGALEPASAKPERATAAPGEKRDA